MDSDKILWEKYYKKFNILAKFINKDGAEFKEFELEKDSHWGPRDVFFINHVFEVMSVEKNL